MDQRLHVTLQVTDELLGIGVIAVLCQCLDEKFC